MDKFKLNRFIKAQEETYNSAMDELKSGSKYGHWMWFIFPQVEGLGSTEMTKKFSIKSLEEAKAYLKHAILGERLLESCEILLKLEDVSISDVMGFPDDLKLRSSMTLFESASSKNSIFSKVIDEYYESSRDNKTLDLLNILEKLN